MPHTFNAESCVRVIFRRDRPKYGEVVAVFPDQLQGRPALVGCYVHNGQHGACNLFETIRTTRLATPTESADLRRELESIGYCVHELRRCPAAARRKAAR